VKLFEPRWPAADIKTFLPRCKTPSGITLSGVLLHSMSMVSRRKRLKKLPGENWLRSVVIEKPAVLSPGPDDIHPSQVYSRACGAYAPATSASPFGGCSFRNRVWQTTSSCWNRCTSLWSVFRNAGWPWFACFIFGGRRGSLSIVRGQSRSGEGFFERVIVSAAHLFSCTGFNRIDFRFTGCHPS